MFVFVCGATFYSIIYGNIGQFVGNLYQAPLTAPPVPGAASPTLFIPRLHPPNNHPHPQRHSRKPSFNPCPPLLPGGAALPQAHRADQRVLAVSLPLASAHERHPQVRQLLLRRHQRPQRRLDRVAAAAAPAARGIPAALSRDGPAGGRSSSITRSVTTTVVRL